MTNRLALALGGVIGAALLLDFAVFDGFATIFLARKGLAAIEWLAFWR